MKRGVPPDVIHSLDAAHLMKTIAYCQKCGIRSFAMVHDSYGTHAPAMAAMSKELRRSFVDTYTKVDIRWIAKSLHDGAIRQQMMELEDLERQGKAAPKDADGWFRFRSLDLPDIQPTDTLNIDDVLEAPYFFA